MTYVMWSPCREPQHNTTSTLGAVFLIVNAALGAGLLNFPKAFDTAGGVAAAVIVQSVLLVFIMAALIILASTSDIKQSVTLQDVMFTVAGRAGRLTTSIIVAVYTFGTCITFLIIIGDQVQYRTDCREIIIWLSSSTEHSTV